MTRLLTESEAIAALRLDAGRRAPGSALRHLRRTRRLGFVRVGNRVLYPASEIEAYIAAHTVHVATAAQVMEGR